MAFLKFSIIATPALVNIPPMVGAAQSTIPTGWISAGCYSDSTSTRTLKTAAYTDVTGMSIESCIAFCTPSAYGYAGVEFGRECYCDKFIGPSGALISNNACDMQCTGNSNEICGGLDAINIFQRTTSTPPAPAPTPTAPSIKTTAGTYQYKGCFQDGVNGNARSLSTQITVSAGVTAESCAAACKAAGYPLAGLEYGQECWCDAYMPLVSPSSDSECNMICKADGLELCGSGNRLAVYEDTDAVSLPSTGCLNSDQLHAVNDKMTFDTFHLFAAPASGTGPTVQLGTHELTAQVGAQSIFILTRDSNESNTFKLKNNVLYPDQWRNEESPIPTSPQPGGTITFVPISAVKPYDGYCAKPNPFQPYGRFIGPPVLSINGYADRWALCNTGVVYTPGPNNANCTQVILLMEQPARARD